MNSLLLLYLKPWTWECRNLLRSKQKMFCCSVKPDSVPVHALDAPWTSRKRSSVQAAEGLMVSVLPLSSCCKRLPDSPAVHLRPLSSRLLPSSQHHNLVLSLGSWGGTTGASNSPPCLINGPEGEKKKKLCSPDRMTGLRDHLIS